MGNNPVRIVLDQNNRLPKDSHIFNNKAKTIVFSKSPTPVHKESVNFEIIDFGNNIAQQIVQILCKHQIQSVIIEGGRQTLQTFIDENLWDEGRQFIGNVNFEEGTKAPIIALKNIEKHTVGNDALIIYRNND